MPLTQFAKQKYVEHGLSIAAYVPANSSVWVVTFTSATGLETGSLTNESTDTGRAVISFEASSTTTERAILNDALVELTPTTGGDTITHWGVIDAASGGNLLMYGAMDNSRTTTAGNKVKFYVGSVGFQMDQPSLQCFTKYFIDNMNDFMFSDPGTTFTMPAASYIAAHTDESDDGSQFEFVGGTYGRIIAPWGSVSIVSGDARASTTSDVVWAAQTDTPAAQWSVWDAITGGNCIVIKDAVDEVVVSGDTVELLAGARIDV